MLKQLLSLTKYQLINMARAKWFISYAVLFFVLTNGFLLFGDDGNKALAGVLSIVLFIVPMISILYAAIHWYNSTSFIYLLLSQPLRRSTVFLSSWLAISLGLAGAFTAGTGAAFLVYGALDTHSAAALFFGSSLTFIFVGIGLLISVLIADPMKGVGVAFLLWFYFSILHDVLVFAAVSLLREYPIEIPAMILMISNPIDLTRVHALLLLDLSAMMGYTGKILQDVLSSPLGSMLTGLAQFLWIALPLGIGLRAFSRRDLFS